MLPERVDAIEQRLASIDGQLHLLTVAIEQFVARQPLLLEVRPTHRRNADGGLGGREEIRETRRGLRKVAGA